MQENTVLEIALDGSEEPVILDGANLETNIETLHCKLFRRNADDTADKFDIVSLPAATQHTGAEYMLGALMKRLPTPLAELAAKFNKFTIVLNTDSAASCLRLRRRLQELFNTIGAPSGMPVMFIMRLCCIFVGAPMIEIGMLERQMF